MARRKYTDSYAKAIATPGPYDAVDSSVIAELFLGGAAHISHSTLPHHWPKWEYPAIRDRPHECIRSGEAYIIYEDYVAIFGEGDLLYIVPKDRCYYEKARKLDWYALQIMNSLRSLPNEWLRLYGGGWTILINLIDHTLYGWHQEYGPVRLTAKGRLYYDGKAYTSLLRSRFTWRSQSDNYRDLTYGREAINQWKNAGRKRRAAKNKIVSHIPAKIKQAVGISSR